MLARLSLLAAGLASLPTYAPAQTPAATFRVPAYTQLILRMKERVNSDRARPGAQFHFSVSEDIVVDGHVVIPAGSGGEGEVLHAVDSGGRDHPGELVLAARFVEVDGRKIKLRSFVAGATDRANDALAVPLFDKDTGGGRGDPANLGRDGMASARTAEDVLLPSREESGDAKPGRTDTPLPETNIHFAGNTGTVVFFREHGKRIQRPPAQIRDGKKIVGSLGTGRYVAIEVPIGIHEFRSRDSSEPDVRLEVDGGETYYFACGQPKAGTHTNCAPSNRSLFEYTKPDLRPAN